MKSKSYSFKQNIAIIKELRATLNLIFCTNGFMARAVVPLGFKIIGKGNIHVAPRMHLILLAIKSHTLPPTKNYLLSFGIHTYLDLAAHLLYRQRKPCVKSLR